VSKPVLKINFADFWKHFNKQDNYFSRLLSPHYTLEISDKPDFLIYSCYGNDYLNYSCYRILYNGENLRANWNACDFAFGFDYINDPRYFRLPNWVLYADPAALLKPKRDPKEILNEKSGFCNMVVSNRHATKRIEFFHKLSKYKKVDSGGRHLNNIGGPVDDKLAFVKRYKFTIAFENSSYPGYTTEKLFEPMLMDSVPVYWGDPLVGKDFNTDSFINYSDFGNDEAVINRIIELDQNDELYFSVIKNPWYNNNELPDCVDEKKILAQFEKIFSGNEKLKPVAQTGKRFLHAAELQWQRIDNFFNRQFKYRKTFR